MSSDLDPWAVFDPAHRDDPYPGYARVASGGRLVALAPSILLAPRYAECTAVLTDPQWGHGYEIGLNPFRPGAAADDVPGSIVRMDPPRHTALRGLVARAFTPRAMAALHASVVAAADVAVDALLDGTRRDGAVEAVRTLADAIPFPVLATLLGVPVERLTALRDALRVVSRGADPDAFLTPSEIAAREAGQRAMEDAFAAELPRATDGLLAALHTADASLPDVLGLATVVLAGGYGTAESVLANALLALARDPGQAGRLRASPALATSGAEEMLRFDPPVQFTHRVALSDRTLAGRLLPRGTGVVVMIAGANRDPEAFPDPQRLDLARYDGPAPAARHLSLSLGVHFCLGAQLGRMEMAALLAAVARRGVAVETAAPPRYRPNVAIRTLDALPLRVTPAP